MYADRIIIPKPSVSDILDQITPFVIDKTHEREFLQRFKMRKALAAKIVGLAQEDKLTPDALFLLLRKNAQTIGTIISLLGLSQEEFYRHVTLARLENRKETKLSEAKFSEWKLERIVSEMKRDRDFADTVFDLLVNGIRNPDLQGRVPPFLRAKLDGGRLATIGQGGIDALIRSGLKGSYDAKKGKPVVDEVEKILKEAGVTYQIGEIPIEHVSRQFDCVIPNAHTLHVAIEIGVFATTARELSEKGLVEMHLRDEIRTHYPDAVIVRVVDGVGWIARGGKALGNVLDASDYIFTQKTLPGLSQVLAAHVPAEYFDAED